MSILLNSGSLDDAPLFLLRNFRSANSDSEKRLQLTASNIFFPVVISMMDWFVAHRRYFIRAAMCSVSFVDDAISLKGTSFVQQVSCCFHYTVRTERWSAIDEFLQQVLCLKSCSSASGNTGINTTIFPRPWWLMGVGLNDVNSRAVLPNAQLRTIGETFKLVVTWTAWRRSYFGKRMQLCTSYVCPLTKLFFYLIVVFGGQVCTLFCERRCVRRLFWNQKRKTKKTMQQ